ncbi:GDSL-type esterase/lipase family protein [Gordonia sp. N1V]|uniref:SGNH/GDSL hydrolase family protein n=1 Tax=Gordonia sp. N1V TaxID=3034163 RepID=UPI0023E147EA|nr:GDSL-type esterase/lipase family protein [Gordonia sp. N1V]MDF3283145.1 GDSL-type esterase/lipase family protein [Gordonia sp. N1V]
MTGPRPTDHHLLRDLGATAAATTAAAGITWGGYNLLVWQAQKTRTVIPHRTDNAPDGDGIYRPDGSGPHRVTRDNRDEIELHLAVFGDSTAAGLGADTGAQTPGARVARRVAVETGHVVRYSNKAIVGATSKGLAAQIDAMLIAGDRPDIAVILVGANDVTARNGVRASAGRLRSAVSRLRAIDAQVVVGTCPDFGVITAIPQPLRSVLRIWGMRLAARQKAAVVSAGGRAVPMADLLAEDFRDAPDRMFSFDRYHPSADGYSLAADILLPEVLAALGEWGPEPLPEPPEVSPSVDNSKLTERVLRIARTVR